MKIKVINRSAFDLPQYETANAVGLDVRANTTEAIRLAPLERARVPTGLYVEIPEEEEPEGEEEIVLPQGYILDVDGDPWVWAAGDGGTLEKRSVSLGAYNDRKSAYVVETGLSMTDYLAWPMDSLK